MNTSIIFGAIGLAVLAGVYYFYRPQQASVLVAQPPTVPITQDPRQANAFCQGVVSTAATGIATYYGGAAGGAAAQKTGASAGAGAGVCAVVGKVNDVQMQAANYVAGKLPGGLGAPFITATKPAIELANPFNVAEHPVDSAKKAVGTVVNTVTSAVHTISSWF